MGLRREALTLFLSLSHGLPEWHSHSTKPPCSRLVLTLQSRYFLTLSLLPPIPPAQLFNFSHKRLIRIACPRLLDVEGKSIHIIHDQLQMVERAGDKKAFPLTSYDPSVTQISCNWRRQMYSFKWLLLHTHAPADWQHPQPRVSPSRTCDARMTATSSCITDTTFGPASSCSYVACVWHVRCA